MREFFYPLSHEIVYKEGRVGTYPVETIIREWTKGNLTNEQAIGQVLLLIQQLQERVKEVEAQLFRWDQRKRD